MNNEKVTKSGEKWGLSTLLENEYFEITIPALLRGVLKGYEIVYARVCLYM